MKILQTFILGAFSWLVINSADTHANENFQQGYHLSIYEKTYPFATYFTIESQDTYRGSVKKSVFRLKTNYDLSNVNGWQATGIKRVLSLGSIYPWATEVDIYNTIGEYIGMIDGQTVSTAAARFSIYDLNNTLVGIAFLDYSLNSYSIVYPDSEAFPIAELHRHHEVDGLNWWDIIIYDDTQIDERIIRIFASMVCDIHPEIDLYYRPKN